jgi:hypothetical protein
VARRRRYVIDLCSGATVIGFVTDEIRRVISIEPEDST